jgi:glycosyltransferase involved in cell wall biosynthesis
MHDELVRVASAEPADLYYGGTTGALAATAEAARRRGVPYALDLEDFHTAEQDDSPAAWLAHALAENIEERILRDAAFLTAGSPPMADAYARKYGVRPIPINNTFALPASDPDLVPSAGDGLRLYWFSQTIGPGRGLEDAVRAMGLAGLSGELHLRGVPLRGYLERLRDLGRRGAPRLALVHHLPATTDPIDLARGYDVGLALEQAHVLNRAICRTNKSFVYMLAGVAVAYTDTPGQHDLALDLGDGALLYEPGDVETLAAGLARWARDKTLLARAKAAAWAAGRRRWHWEHPAERGALLAAVSGALDARQLCA